MNRLRSLGLNQPLLSQVPFDRLDSLGRVVFESHAHCVVAAEDADLPAQLHPKLRDSSDRVVVGDWVLLDRSGDPCWIVERLDRAGVLARRDPGRGIQVLCANVDRALIATALDRDLNPRRLERYLAVVAEVGLPAILVLTKVDLEPGAIAPAVEALGPRFEAVIPVCAPRGEGIDRVLAQIPSGVTASLLGSSGVGKTTLVSALAGTSLDTGAIRASDSRGRHTTTARRLVPLPGAGWLVDNPGLRQVGPIGLAGVAQAFPEVEDLAGRCRFGDCWHDSEPGCAIQEALASGELSEERYQAWAKLEREVAWELRQSDRRARQAERARWKQISRQQREREVFRRRNDGS